MKTAWRRIAAGVALGLTAAVAGPAQAAPLPASAVAEIDAITTGAPRYANSTWGIVVDDAATAEAGSGAAWAVPATAAVRPSATPAAILRQAVFIRPRPSRSGASPASLPGRAACVQPPRTGMQRYQRPIDPVDRRNYEAGATTTNRR